MADQTETDLDYLRWHWASAYIIERKAGNWRAERRDNREVIRAKSALALLDRIRDDYAANPVPRQELPASDIKTDNVVRRFGG